jgi:hypothetical protein
MRQTYHSGDLRPKFKVLLAGRIILAIDLVFQTLLGEVMITSAGGGSGGGSDSRSLDSTNRPRDLAQLFSSTNPS